MGHSLNYLDDTSFKEIDGRLRKRVMYGVRKAVAKIPNLIYEQRRSYDAFLQLDVNPKERKNLGLQNVLSTIFPISDTDGSATVEFVKYEVEKPKYEVSECIQRSVNYSAALRVTLRLIVWDIDEDTGTREIKGIKEQDVYMAEIPMMTQSGTFIINGAERVIVSQMHRSPGVFYDHDSGKTQSSGKYIYSARIIPYRGSWLDFEFDSKDILYFRIDRKRKMYITTLLRALGHDKSSILKEFYDEISFQRAGDVWKVPFNAAKLRGMKIFHDIVNAETGEVIIEAGTKVTPRIIQKFEKEKVVERLVSEDEILGSYVARDIIDESTGEILMEAGDEIVSDLLERIKGCGIKTFKVLDIDYINVGPYIRNTLVLDSNESKEEALADIYRVLRPGEPSTPEAAETLFKQTFFENDRYDLASIGRMKINKRHNLDIPETVTVLTERDILSVVKFLVRLKDGFGEIDDIDNLGNRRVRSVGELVENQFRIGMIRMERAIQERLAAVEIDTVMPHDLINPKILMSVIREFFGTSQLSQFMDQTNPLSEITHKRRLSALGPGGLTRERASFEVRDVHPTHYGRICPIETPEGQNIGLINSLATYASINKYGFIESPYRVVKDGMVTDDVVYLSAMEEGQYVIAQASASLDPNGKLKDEFVRCRKEGEIILAKPSEVNYMDVSPKQLVSVAASLIPFLENNDANRALMGSNMQRQAVPLLRAEAPLVGTGMEAIVARDSGATVIAKREGVVFQVDAHRIVVRSFEIGDDKSGGVDIYKLTKFQKSNQNTAINQRPIVKVGDVVRKGSVIADGPSTDLGELALGRNVLVAFAPRNGYNYEDSILLSQRIVSEDVFTSLHIDEFEVVARDTRIGPEDITRDIPNVSEEHLKHLDEIGMVHVGAEVKQGDILVGKVTPKSESPVTPEEKLLRAIFGEKASDVRDSSLRVPPGVKGTVVDVRIFTRRGVEKDERALALERAEIERLSKDRDIELAIIEDYASDRLEHLLIGKKVVSAGKNIKAGSEITKEMLVAVGKKQLWQVVVDDAHVMDELLKLKEFYDRSHTDIERNFKRNVEKAQSGDDLPQGALKVVKVYVATKQKIQPGDKMAGRHGNKGVVSKIVPVEDMPFLEDGTPVDIVLNPLGVPSRMNVGQIFETHLGWAAAAMGANINTALQKYHEGADIKLVRDSLLNAYDNENCADFCEYLRGINESELCEIAKNVSHGVPYGTPVFEGAKDSQISELLEKAGLNSSGQTILYDGHTGEAFDRPVTIGYIYMLKLDHLVDDKIHARSIGPYSLVTQQPLGGKSHFGGQRFGEMECWALQAYGAAYTLQEMLTVKSDDVSGRIKIYESIVRGDYSFDSGLPESFNVMIKELRSLCLNVEMHNSDQSVEK